MKKIIYYIAILFLVTGFTSCRDDIPEMKAPEDYDGDNFDQIFEAFWTGMNHNYLFWDIDPTDWDKMYDKYKPLFAGLDVYSESDAILAHSYFKEMTADIIDSHYVIAFNSPWASSLPYISPSTQRKMQSPSYHSVIPDYYFSSVLPHNYLGDYVHGTIETDDGILDVVSGTVLDERVLYLHCNMFALLVTSLEESGSSAETAINHFFNNLLGQNSFSGIILDVRSNRGGYNVDLDFLLGSMIEKPLLIAHERNKQGEGRLDYSPWRERYVLPQPWKRPVSVPIVVLTDMHSSSLAEMLPMAVKALPNGYVVGERTWGALGSLTDNAIYNGGAFSTPFMEVVYTASMETKYIDGVNYEGIGFPPDVEVQYNESDLIQGNDAFMETAIKIIRRGGL